MVRILSHPPIWSLVPLSSARRPLSLSAPSPKTFRTFLFEKEVFFSLFLARGKECTSSCKKLEMAGGTKWR